MIVFPDKRSPGFAAIVAATLTGLLLAWPLAAQEGAGSAADPVAKAPGAPPEEGGREDKTGVRTRYLGPGALVPAGRDAATGKPRPIAPGPFVPAGSIDGGASGMAVARAEPGAGEDQTGPPVEETGPRSLLGRDAPEVDELANLDPAAIGVLEPGEGGLPVNIWRGTRRSTLEALIPKLPVRAPSPAMNRLVRRLLLSSVAMPPLSADGDEGLSLLEARLERVAASGNLAALLELLERVAPRHETRVIRDIRADAYLMDGDILGACGVARTARGDEGSVKWLKILSLCQALEGDRGGVAFNIGLLRETGDMSPLYGYLIARVLDRAQGIVPDSRGGGGAADGPPPLPAAPLDALTAALYRAAGAPVPTAVLDSAPAIVLASLAGRGDLDLEFRTEAGEIAARTGIVPATDLVSAFAAMEFSEDEKATAFLLAETDLGARIDGLLYYLAASAPTPGEKARYLKAAWRRALREGMHPALAAVLAGPAATIPLAKENISAAHDIVRIALYAGDKGLAKRWYELARTRASERDVAATKALVDMWPLMITADDAGDIPFSLQILDLWRQSLAVLPLDQQRGRAAYFYGLLEALGYTVDNALWDEVLGAPVIGQGAAPTLGVWRQLLIATEAGRLGEGLLLALITIGDAGPAGVDPSALSSALRALVGLGFEEGARALALEALVANGF